MAKKIVGNIVGIPNPQPDWNQTDPTKADYIKNKPDLNKKADKTTFLSKTTKIDNGAIVIDTIPVGTEIILKVTGLPKLQKEGDAHYVEYGFRKDRGEPFLAVGLTPDDKGNATISLPVTSDLVPDADVADVFWIAVCTEFGDVAELAEPLTVEYTRLENISTSVARHETQINDMSDGLVKGFGVPFDVNGTGFVSIDKVHPKEHDVEISTNAESVTVLGNNMIPFPYIANYKEHNGVTFVVNDDGTVTANGTATAQAYIAIANKAGLGLANGTYCLSGTPSENNEDYKCYITYAGIPQDGRTDGKVITINDSTSQNLMTCVVSAGKTVNNFVFKPMLEVGTKATKFELYKKATYPVTDGKVIVPSVSPTMNITTPTSGANIEAKGYQDGLAVINEIKQAIISLGGNI